MRKARTLALWRSSAAKSALVVTAGAAASSAARFVRQHQGGGLGVGPVGAQRLDDGGQHQPLNIGARRVVGAKSVALGGVEGAFQQSAQDGGLDLAPVGLGGFNQEVNLRGREQQAVVGLAGALEQLAVEVQHGFCQGGTETAGVHIGPQDAHHLLQRGRVVPVGFAAGPESCLWGAAPHLRRTCRTGSG